MIPKARFFCECKALIKEQQIRRVAYAFLLSYPAGTEIEIRPTMTRGNHSRIATTLSITRGNTHSILVSQYDSTGTSSIGRSLV